MNRTKLDSWICKTEALPELTREGLERLQLKRLNETLACIHDRGGADRGYPRRLDTLAQLERLGAFPIRAGFGWSWEEACALVRDTRPDTYIGFPVPLLGLVRMYGPDFPIRRALVSGDDCPAGVMAELEGLLGSRLYPHYGSRECGLGGAVT
ncbi:MAG: hypothetical protein J6J81_07000, partial [Oscillospiraceae bacterium]|nr:hypothetical protein [Oscillospiraceae bacterium]